MNSVALPAPPAVAHAIARCLSESLSPDGIYLFGSHARGEASQDSDLDFLAIVPTSDQSRYQRALSARKSVAEFRVPKDIIVLTRQEWEDELRVPSSLASTVLREGIALHGA